jgi:hypothetical protein
MSVRKIAAQLRGAARHIRFGAPKEICIDDASIAENQPHSDAIPSRQSTRYSKLSGIGSGDPDHVWVEICADAQPFW